jgi:hypothetical protein
MDYFDPIRPTQKCRCHSQPAHHPREFWRPDHQEQQTPHTYRASVHVIVATLLWTVEVFITSYSNCIPFRVFWQPYIITGNTHESKSLLKGNMNFWRLRLRCTFDVNCTYLPKNWISKETYWNIVKHHWCGISLPINNGVNDRRYLTVIDYPPIDPLFQAVANPISFGLALVVRSSKVKYTSIVRKRNLVCF